MLKLLAGFNFVGGQNHSLLCQVFCKARRTSPSVLYIPHIQQWWETAGPPLRASFLSLLASIPSFSPILLLATCNIPHPQLDPEVRSWPASDIRNIVRLLWSPSVSVVRFGPCFGRSTGRFTPSVFPPGRRGLTSSRTSSLTRRPRPRPPRREHVCDPRRKKKSLTLLWNLTQILLFRLKIKQSLFWSIKINWCFPSSCPSQWLRLWRSFPWLPCLAPASCRSRRASFWRSRRRKCCESSASFCATSPNVCPCAAASRPSPNRST